jgi:hypothetical protein
MKHPELKITKAIFLKLAPKRRMEIIYQLNVENAELVQVVKAKSGWNMSSPDMVNDWEKYQAKKITTKLPIEIKKNAPQDMKFIGDILEHFHFNFILNGNLNVFMFGEMEYIIPKQDTKYKYTYVIHVRPNGTFNHIKNINTSI